MEKNSTKAPKLDESTLIEIISNLKKLISENEKLRTKYPDEPSKFAKCETELYATLDQLQAVGTQPELYKVLLSKNVSTLLNSLTKHENSDISGKTVSVINEIIQFDDDDDEFDGSSEFVESLYKGGLLDNMVRGLEKYDKKKRDEVDMIENSINAISTMIERYDIRHGGQGWVIKFQEWAIEQLNSTKFNPSKLSMIDLLTTTIFHPENAQYFYQADGINTLLKQIAHYRKNTPTTGSELEYLHQVLSCFSKCMMDHEEREQTRECLYDNEGVELIVLILRDKTDAISKTLMKFYLIRALNNAITASQNHEPIVTKICESFIENLGLKALFPFFLEPKSIIPKNHRKPGSISLVDEAEEQLTGIILALLKHCQNTEYLQRILLKFAEKKYEKFDRLIELHEKYFEKQRGKTDDQDAMEQAWFNSEQIIYTFLMLCYLSEQYETYDFNGGEKFSSRLRRLLKIDKPLLKSQVLEFTKNYIDDLPEAAKQEKSSLGFLADHFMKFCEKSKIV